MPLTAKGERILAEMKRKYGDRRGEQVFYASRNKGTITGVDSVNPEVRRIEATITPGKAKLAHEGEMEKLLKATDSVGKLAARFDSFLVRRRSGFKTRHDAIAKITGVRESGEDMLMIEWVDTKGKSGTTHGQKNNTHMQQLLARAKREGAKGA